jgi:hypothetical protein
MLLIKTTLSVMLPKLINTVGMRLFLVAPFREKSPLHPNTRVTTTYPDQRLSFNEWTQYLYKQIK